MAGVLSTCRNVTLVNLPQHSSKIAERSCVFQRIVVRLKSFNVKFPESGQNYQYMQRSSVPTMHFQDSLPRLPIPELHKTCERYLRAQQPLLHPDAYPHTESFVKEFLNSDGIKCQDALVREDQLNKGTSFISKPWFDMYLSDRSPLPINFNPFLVFVDNPSPLYNSQLVKSSNLVVSSLRFFRSLNDDVLAPEVYHMNPAKSNNSTFRLVTRMLPKSISWYGAYLFKAYPLDMSQYEFLFNTSRIPGLDKDVIKHVRGKHILVMRKGHFYVFDVLDKNGDIVGPDVIMTNIEHILESKESEAEHPLGVLTTERRDVWASARAHLESLGNADVLHLIDTSLFNLVLDDKTPGKDPVSLVKLFLHADGANRWFDKSFSLIVTEDGTAGVNFEHSWGDGVAVLRYFNDIHVDSVRNPKVHYNLLRAESISVKQLEFKLDDKIKNSIAEAKRNYEKTCNSLEVRVMDYQKFGRQLCKPLSISPDAMMQLSFQMAYDQLAGHQVATYESCSTAAFKHGRTETVRPCTLETQEVCKAIKMSSLPSKRQFQAMIVQCSKVHSNLIKEAAMGQGFDRHLFALRLKAEAAGLKPAIFSDPAYAAINHNILSTSTLSSDNLQLGAFGPVVNNGFGVGYSVWSDRLGSIVTNFKGQSDGSGFVSALEDSLDKIYAILKK